MVKGTATGLRRNMRTWLWPVPVAGIVVGVVLAILLPRVDARLDHALPPVLDNGLFGGDPGAARTVLSAVSTSLITVTSLTFSITVVSLQLASSQFSPRLLRTFTGDLFVQATMAVFLATFTYSLVLLRATHRSIGSFSQFVPRISVAVSLALAAASVLMLVLFLAHLARQVRVEGMLRAVHAEALSTVRTTLAGPGARTGAPVQAADRQDDVPCPPGTAMTVLAPSSGFLVRIQEAYLLRVAMGAGAVVLIDCSPGCSLVKGTPIGKAWPVAGQAFDDLTSARLRRDLGKAIRTGFERTAVQDIGYGLRQMTDVANKALSPGINDPTTAVHALGHISALLGELASRNPGPLLLRDEECRIRVVLARPDLAQLLDEAITQPRRYGAADPQVMARLYVLLAELAWQVGPEQHPAIRQQLSRLEDTTAQQDFGEPERAGLARLAHDVDNAFVGQYTPRRLQRAPRQQGDAP